jgi:hypothetical protein
MKEKPDCITPEFHIIRHVLHINMQNKGTFIANE